MRQVEMVLRAVTMTGGVIGAASIFLLMLLTVITVVFRFVGIAFPGTYQIAELLLIPAVSFSLLYAGYASAHTRVELIIHWFPPRLRSVVDALVEALGVVFWGLVTYAVSREAWRHFSENEISPIIGVPVAPFRLLMVTALALFCIMLAVQVVRAAQGKVTDATDAGDFDE